MGSVSAIFNILEIIMDVRFQMHTFPILLVLKMEAQNQGRIFWMASRVYIHHVLRESLLVLEKFLPSMIWKIAGEIVDLSIAWLIDYFSSLPLRPVGIVVVVSRSPNPALILPGSDAANLIRTFGSTSIAAEHHAEGWSEEINEQAAMRSVIDDAVVELVMIHRQICNISEYRKVQWL